MPKVFFVQEHREVEVEPGRTLREIALEVGIDPNRKYQRLFSCDGRGLFDGCKCWVKDLGTATHEVKSGENAETIAAQYGVSVDALAELNGATASAFAPKSGEAIKVPAMNPRSFTERALHSLKGWQRLACQARLMRGEIEVWTMVQGDERLRAPRAIAPPPPGPAKRERFLESRFRKGGAEEEGEEEKPKAKPKPAAAKPAAAKPAAEAATDKPTAEAKSAAEAKPAPADKPAAEAKSAAEPKPAAADKPAAEAKSAAEPKPAAADKPAAEAKSAAAASAPPPSPSKPPTVAVATPIVSPIVSPIVEQATEKATEKAAEKVVEPPAEKPVEPEEKK
jgi:hypothetical protein